MTLECGSGVFVAENFGLAAGQDQTVQTGFVDDEQVSFLLNSVFRPGVN